VAGRRSGRSRVAALLAAGVPLDKGLASARTLFGPSFQPSECLKALVYFEGGDLDTLREETRAQLIAAATDRGCERRGRPAGDSDRFALAGASRRFASIGPWVLALDARIVVTHR